MPHHMIAVPHKRVFLRHHRYKHHAKGAGAPILLHSGLGVTVGEPVGTAAIPTAKSVHKPKKKIFRLKF